MSSSTVPLTTNGVQALIDRIREEGVVAARAQARQILADANASATAIETQAEARARKLIEEARTQIANEKAAGEQAIRNAARDALLDLRNQVRAAFEVHVRRLVSEQAKDPGFIRSLVLTLAGHAAEQYITDQDAAIFVSDTLAGAVEPGESSAAINEKVCNAVLAAAGQMLREGIELCADAKITGGARVRLVGQDLEINLTDEALTRLLLKHLMPRYRAIIEAQEGG